MMAASNYEFKFPKLYRMKLPSLPDDIADVYGILGKAPDGFSYRLVGVDSETNEAVYYVDKDDRR